MSINPGSVRRIEGLIPYGCVLGVIILLLIAEPHLSAMVIVVGMEMCIRDRLRPGGRAVIRQNGPSRPSALR